MKRTLFWVFILFYFSSYTQQDTAARLNLFFDVDKYGLTKTHRVMIDSALIGKQVTITHIKGFADSTGNSSYNRELARKRALAIYSYIHKAYSDPITVEYFGEEHADGKDISYDRRVEIFYSIRIPQQQIPPKNNNTDTLAVTEKYEITNIYFIPDKAIVEPASFFAVDDAAEYLKKFPQCKFEIVGHVNNGMVPSEANAKALEPVRKLSEERAKAIYDLMIERGIPAASMTYNGVGNTEMVFKKPKNDEEKRKNMRVEILISCKK